MSIYSYSKELRDIINELRLEIKYKNIRINIMNHLPYLKKGHLCLGNEIHVLFDLYFYLNGGTTGENFINRNIAYVKHIDTDKDKYNIGKERAILDCLTVIIINYNQTPFEPFKSKIPNIYEILKVCMGDIKIPKIYNLLNIITLNYDMKLIYNIISDNFNYVKSNVDYNIACPFIGYSVARLEDNKINYYVKSVCIKRLWYIKQVLLDTDSDITKVILDYFKYWML